MEEIADGRVNSIRFSIASSEEILTSSADKLAISNLSRPNSFLGLPLESGKCESCGTSEHGECEGHFGYIELPTQIYHPCHVSEVKRILSLVCLNCLSIRKEQGKRTIGVERSSNAQCLYCQGFPPISVKEIKTTDGALCLELKVPSRGRLPDGFWSFLKRYGYNYDDCFSRPLLPYEALRILKELPKDTRIKLAKKGCFPQAGLIMERLPVPPNCLSIPEIPDGIRNMSSDPAISKLRIVLNQALRIKSSRCGPANFESHRIEADALQLAWTSYLQLRGVTKAHHGMNRKAGVATVTNGSATKVWLEKMRTLFIRKSSGFSSRSIITGDAYKGINEIGLPLEIARRITFEERVTSFNRGSLQKVLDNGLCLTLRDGLTKYAMRESMKGQVLKVGQVISRRIMDGDVVFINRPPSTHKHSLQAFSVYIHEDHTVKINPLICGPLGADFDGDCVSLFYPQSLAAKAEVLELFSVEQQLLSSHSGNLNLQLVHDSILSLKLLFKTHFLDKETAQQLAMWASPMLAEPAITKAKIPGKSFGPLWTALQVLQTAFPTRFNCSGERHRIFESNILEFHYNTDTVQSSFTEIFTSTLFMKGPKETLKVVNTLQPLLMETLFLEGFSIGLKDFDIPKPAVEKVKKSLQGISPVLRHMLSSYNEILELQVDNYLRDVKLPIIGFILKSSSLGVLIDSKSDQSISKVVQQLGFLGVQLFSRGKYYSKELVEDMFLFFRRKYPETQFDCPESFGFVKSSLFQGLNPFDELSHSIGTREALIRASRGLTEPGILFKNLMAVLRDVVICYDGTVRNTCNNSIIQFEYGGKLGTNPGLYSTAGEPVGVLAATAISNPAYKAVLDSSQSNASSWKMMKEILLCKCDSKNDLIDRRVILYLNECNCGKRYCKEKAAFSIQNHLKRVALKDVAMDFVIEYQKEPISPQSSRIEACLVGHIHLDKTWMKQSNRTMDGILQNCQEVINCFGKKKHPLHHFSKRIFLGASEYCSLNQPYDGNCSPLPCLQFSFLDVGGAFHGGNIERASQIMTNTIYPILLDTIVEGDPRVSTVNITWTDPDTISWVRKPCNKRKGEVCLEVVIDKKAIKRKGDAWRIVLDSCLPVLHLIDITRSIPYGIQQIHEVLGVSCSFFVSVQRLSMSIRKVAKGVLIEHLVLVVDSMAYTGNLIGFNTAGYKALFRSLKVQVPFTEATLYMPMKCFERAAERCYKDNLSSIVASCSWGKHVAIGSGTSFEVMWSQKDMDADQDVGANVYDFLQLVKTTASEREVSTSCLGADVDDLEEEINMESSVSPEHVSNGGDLTFDDSAEVLTILEGKTESEKGKFGKISWEDDTVPAVKSNGWGSWNVGKQSDADNDDTLAARPIVNSGWDAGEKQKKYPSQPATSDTWGGLTCGEQNDTSTAGQSVHSAWDAGERQKNHPSQAATSDAWGVSACGDQNDTSAARPSVRSGWDAGEKGKNYPSQLTISDPWSGLTCGEQNNTSTAKPSVFSGWDAGEKQKSPSWLATSEASGRWTSNNVQAESGQPNTSTDSNGSNRNEMNSQTGQREVSPVKSQGWGSTATQNQIRDHHPNRSSPKPDVWGDWGSSNTNTERSKHDTPVKDNITAWDADPKRANINQPARSQGSNDWGSWSTDEMEQQKNNSAKSPMELVDRNGWNSNDSHNEREVWNASKDGNAFSQQSNGHGWGFSETNSKKRDRNAWKTNDKGNDDKGDTVNCTNAAFSDLKEKKWGLPESPRLGFGEVTDELRQPPGFGSKSKRYTKAPSGARNDKYRGTPADSDIGDASGANTREKSRTEGLYTSRGKRLDLFTSEELPILSDVEPLMQSMIRIMHQYNDGDRLTPEDQSYVIDNVLLHHPDPNKAAKLGDIDFLMIDRPEKYKDSRCLHIVSADGSKEDVSYLKCLKNFVTEKHPEHAESFSRKYFGPKQSQHP